MRKLNEFNLIIDDNDVGFAYDDVDWFYRTIFEQVLVCFEIVCSFGDSAVSGNVMLYNAGDFMMVTVLRGWTPTAGDWIIMMAIFSI